MGKGYFLFMFVLMLTQPQRNAPSPPHNLSAKQVLAGYEHSLSFMTERVSFNAETETTFNGAFELKQKRVTEKRILYRDGSRFGASVETKGFDDQQKMIWHNKTRSIVGSEEMMSYNAPPGKPPRSLLVDSQPKTLDTGLVLNVGFGRVLDGITFGDDNKSFVEVMQQAPSLRLREEMEIIDGYATYVLEADNKYGQHILWIDPEYGFNPRRMVIRKAIGDFYNKTKLGDTPPPLSPKLNLAIPWCAKVRTELTVDSIKIEKSGEVFVPVSAKVVEHMDYENGQFTEWISTYRRTNINFNPDFDAMMEAFLADIPEGTPVFFQDERGLSGVRYEWFNGKVRAKVDEAFLDGLDNQIGQLQCEAKAESAVPTEEKTEISPDESSAIAGAQTNTLDAEPEILSESRPFPMLLLIPIGLLVIGFITWRVFLLKRG